MQAELEGLLVEDAALRRRVAARLHSSEDAASRVLWNWLLESVRAAYGFRIAQIPRPPSYIESVVGERLRQIDEMLSVLYPVDVEARIETVCAVAALIDAEIAWTHENAGRSLSRALFDLQRVHCDDAGLVLPLPSYWEPGLDSRLRVRTLIERGIASGETWYPHYEDVVLDSCARFEAHLTTLNAHRDPTVRRAASACLRTYVSAREQRLNLRADQILITPDAIRRVLREYRHLFLNQWSLGLGHDDSSVVVLGAEHAYELNLDADIVNLCTESIGCGVIWLSGGRRDVVRAVSGGAVNTVRPFQVHPNDHYCKGSSHTWAKLATALGQSGSHQPGCLPGLGSFCYQIELSAHPSQATTGSQPPTPARVAFLRLVMQRLRETACVLLIHGSTSTSGHENARFEIARAFLGAECRGALTTPHAWSEPGRPIQVADSGGRRVIKTRALANQGSTDTFLSRIAELVGEAL